MFGEWKVNVENDQQGRKITDRVIKFDMMDIVQDQYRRCGCYCDSELVNNSLHRLLLSIHDEREQ
jgi:hypothetical protein